jgi:hypothetical protein
VHLPSELVEPVRHSESCPSQKQRFPCFSTRFSVSNSVFEMSVTASFGGKNLAGRSP